MPLSAKRESVLDSLGFHQNSRSLPWAVPASAECLSMRLKTDDSYFKNGIRESAPKVIAAPVSNQRQQPMRKLKVCQVVASAEGGRWLVEQLRDLRDIYGCEVMAVVGGETGGLIDNLRANNIPYHAEDFIFWSLRSILRLPFTILRQARLFRRERHMTVP